jgi:hypothetical protein
MTIADNPENTIPARFIPSSMSNVVTPSRLAITETATEPCSAGQAHPASPMKSSASWPTLDGA